jgi:AmmeMemoRadiSam system protein B
LFKTVSGNTYDTVIIIAPYHTAERGAVVTFACDWLTPFGRLQNDDALSELLAVSGGLHAVNAPEVMEADHSASYLFPFVKDYLPESRISAVLIARTAEKAQVQALTEVISSYAEGKRVLVIGSVDFSHFLMPGEAAKRDEETIKAIEDGDEDALLSMTNSNLDSPQTFLTVIGYAKKRGIAPLTLLDHSSSDRELGIPPEAVNPKEGTTTYLLYAALQQ